MKEFFRPTKFKIYFTITAVFLALIDIAFGIDLFHAGLITEFITRTITFLFIPVMFSINEVFSFITCPENVDFICNISGLILGLVLIYIIACIFEKIKFKKIIILILIILAIIFSFVSIFIQTKQMYNRTPVSFPTLP